MSCRQHTDAGANPHWHHVRKLGSLLGHRVQIWVKFRSYSSFLISSASCNAATASPEFPGPRRAARAACRGDTGPCGGGARERRRLPLPILARGRPRASPEAARDCAPWGRSAVRSCGPRSALPGAQFWSRHEVGDERRRGGELRRPGRSFRRRFDRLLRLEETDYEEASREARVKYPPTPARTPSPGCRTRALDRLILELGDKLAGRLDVGHGLGRPERRQVLGSVNVADRAAQYLERGRDFGQRLAARVSSRLPTTSLQPADHLAWWGRSRHVEERAPAFEASSSESKLSLIGAWKRRRCPPVPRCMCCARACRPARLGDFRPRPGRARRTRDSPSGMICPPGVASGVTPPGAQDLVPCDAGHPMRYAARMGPTPADFAAPPSRRMPSCATTGAGSSLVAGQRLHVRWPRNRSRPASRARAMAERCGGHPCRVVPAHEADHGPRRHNVWPFPSAGAAAPPGARRSSVGAGFVGRASLDLMATFAMEPTIRLRPVAQDSRSRVLCQLCSLTKASILRQSVIAGVLPLLEAAVEEAVAALYS